MLANGVVNGVNARHPVGHPVWLTKLPLMVKTKDGYLPIQGTYNGLQSFYIESRG